LWGFKKLASKPWPVAGAAISSPQGSVTFDLKDYLQTETISRLFVRVVGTLNVNAPGAATNGAVVVDVSGSTVYIRPQNDKAALNAKNAQDDQIILDVQSRIANYTSYNHSKTYSGRDALKQTFVNAMNRRLSAEQVQKEVEAKIDSMAGNNSIR